MTDAGYNAQQCSPATWGGPTGSPRWPMTVGGPLSSDAATIRSRAGYRLQPCKALAMLYVDVFRRHGFGFTKWCFLWQSVHLCRSVGRCRIGGCFMQIRGRRSVLRAGQFKIGCPVAVSSSATSGLHLNYVAQLMNWRMEPMRAIVVCTGDLVRRARRRSRRIPRFHPGREPLFDRSSASRLLSRE